MFGFFGGQENKRLDDIIKNFNENDIKGTFTKLIDYFRDNQNTVDKTKTSLELNIEEHKIIYDKIISVIANKKDNNGNFIYKNSDIAYHPFFKYFLISLIGVNYHASEYYSIIELKEENIKKKFNGFYTCECIFNPNNYGQLRGHIEGYYKNDVEIVKKFGEFIGQTENVETLIINIKKMQVLSLIDLCNVKRTEKVTEIKEIEKIITKTVTEKGEPAKPYIPQEIINLLNAKLGESFDIKQLELSDIEEKIEKEEKKENDILKKSKKLPQQPNKNVVIPIKDIKTGKGEYFRMLSNIIGDIPNYTQMRESIYSKYELALDFPKYRVEGVEINKFGDNKRKAEDDTNKETVVTFAKNLRDFSSGITIINSQVLNNEDLNMYAKNIKDVASMIADLVNVSDNDINTKKVDTIFKEKGYDINGVISKIKTNQDGGNKQYHKKYLKYKAKYMQLKNN